MKTTPQLLILTLIGSLSAPTYAESDTLGAAIVGGKPSIDARYRIENVDQAQFSEKSTASTLRTRLGYATDSYKGFSVFAEVDGVLSIGSEDFTTPSAGPVATPQGPKRALQPVIADPTDSSLNRLHLSYQNKSTKVIAGRQRIIRSGARFVGNVGWRQHEQTYDGVSIENNSVKDLTLFAAYIAKRNTITFTDIDQDTLLIDVQYKGLPNGKLSAYYYDIKVDKTNNEWKNLGARYEGKVNDFSYSLEYATQENGAGAKPDYKHINAAYKFTPLTVSAGIEVLGSDENSGFATPLATLHKFNGWADQFLATPQEGLDDKYFSVSTTLNKLNLSAVYHSFESDVQNIDLGSEWNASITSKIRKGIVLGAKLADYDAGNTQNGKNDTKKVWVWAQAKF